MVCEKCQKKLGKVITPDPWKSGARNTTESGGRIINENKALTSRKNRFNPYSTFEKCRICKSSVHQVGSHYCQACAYKKGPPDRNVKKKNKDEDNCLNTPKNIEKIMVSVPCVERK